MLVFELLDVITYIINQHQVLINSLFKKEKKSKHFFLLFPSFRFSNQKQPY